jgi:altronate dehydratase
MINALKINASDNVVVALSDLPAGARLQAAQPAGELGVTALEPIPFGHKVAVAPIAQGQEVIKYGARIGLATANIVPGQHVHVHNLRSVRGAAKS